MKQLKIYLAAIAFMVIAGTAQAQYKGPGAEGKIFTVEEVNNQASKLDKRDTMVKLKGKIIEQINNENFWFSDETGKIKIEIEKKHMPPVPFDETTEVIIIGEVDNDFLEGVEIEVKQFKLPGTSDLTN